ncbi:hypothetical protein TrVE_jg1014 [Triparma verrucosa]|nr:hypothetical protein TrVE_jg1014 [Triparma verrucosa]
MKDMFSSQQQWGEVSKKRNEEAKQRLKEQAALEEAESLLRLQKLEEESENPNAENYGPGDLSNLGSGILDEGAWEASKGDDDSGLIVLENDAEGDNLLIDGSDSEGGLIF